MKSSPCFASAADHSSTRLKKSRLLPRRNIPMPLAREVDRWLGLHRPRAIDTKKQRGDVYAALLMCLYAPAHSVPGLCRAEAQL
jgi:hypothetical protein